ncbi:MAG TPA: hypothetical protein VFB07_03145 [Vicinamibacterales bacterium]|nr:hypothetical protein [Vicinamibacterales bacterium]
MMIRLVSAATWPTPVLSSAFSNNFDPQGLAMTICVGYFQPEPLETRRTFTVSGYVASKGRWRQFDSIWNRALGQAGIAAFHAREFSYGSGEFANGWHDVARKTRLVERLARITEQHIVRAFSCSVAVEDYESVHHGRRLGVTTGLYGLCAGLLVASVRRWMTEHRPDDLTLFVFEDGDVDHREISRVATADRSIRGEPAQVWPRRWIDEVGRTRHIRPFEAVDLLTVDGGGALISRLRERDRFEAEVVDRGRLLALSRAESVQDPSERLDV